MFLAFLCALFSVSGLAAENPFQEGTESITLSHEERALFLEYADTSKARLEKALDQAKGKGFEEQNTIYLAAIRSTVINSRKLKPGTELLLRVALNQALELSFGIPGGTSGVLASSANRELLTVLLEDSIQLAIRYYLEDRVAIEGGTLHDLPFLRFAAERLELAREWLSAITETNLLVQAQLAVLRHWLYAAAHAGQKRRSEHAEEMILVDRVLKDSDADPKKRNPAELRRHLRLLHERTRAKLVRAGTSPEPRDLLLAPPPPAREPGPVEESSQTESGRELRKVFGGSEIFQLKAMGYTGWGAAETGGLSFEAKFSGIAGSPDLTQFRERGDGWARGRDFDLIAEMRFENKPGSWEMRKLIMDAVFLMGHGQFADKDFRTIKTFAGLKIGSIARLDEATGVNLMGSVLGIVPYAVDVIHNSDWSYGAAIDVLNVVYGTDGDIQGEDAEKAKAFWHGKVAGWLKRKVGRVGTLSDRAEADWLTEDLTEGRYFIQFTNDLALERIARLPFGVNARYTQMYTRTSREATYRQLLFGIRVDL